VAKLVIAPACQAGDRGFNPRRSRRINRPGYFRAVFYHHISLFIPVNIPYNQHMKDHLQKSCRPLHREEIGQLQAKGCTAENWESVSVTGSINPERFRNVRFSGTVCLGEFTGSITLESGVKLPTGIYDAVLHNVTVGDNCLIKQINHHIANYRIGSDTVIINTEFLTVDGETSFGNGVDITVINEGGGREIPMYDTLSSHTAYLIALYRHRKKMIRNLQGLIADYAAGKADTTGTIGSHVRIHNCQIIRNVNIESYAQIEGAGELSNGTIRSCREDPAYIGINVIAKDFILCEGGSVSENTILDHCFVGQATQLSKQYSAENSVFFANCGGYHGEACSVFAGPFTVTHHKATLLIACLVSFLNAGSGSNQSNHMYKLGPNHQGIIERGSKTASDSYMLWPMKVGAFTLIMGRHYSNSDTTEFPFSYLIENDGESLLIPAVNLRSIGTVRDSRKWASRDKRKAPKRFDYINYHLLTPYTVRHIMAGIEKLQEIRLMSGHTSQNYYYNGVKIRRSALEKGIKLYEIALDRYLGNIVVNFLRRGEWSTLEELRTILKPGLSAGTGDWIDISGLIAPRDEVEKIITAIADGEISSIADVDERFFQLDRDFEQYELAWVVSRIGERYGKPVSSFTAEDFIILLDRWIDAVAQLDEMRCRDAEKEFEQTARVGYALNDGEAERDEEYRVINGVVGDNGFISDLLERLAAKQKTAAELRGKIAALK
jgi:hypothetical protein